ncbi:MAG: hypothetical protein ACJ757_10750 [Gaiellaceae bacterium]
MDTYRTVLFLHLLALFVGIGAAAILGLSLFRLRAAQTLADALPWGILAGKTERAFPVAIVGLFLTGAYMTSDVWTWSTGWIDVAIVSLAVIAAQGVLIAGRRAKVLERALEANGAGPLSEVARKLTCDRALWIVSFANPGIVLGVVWVMTQKPGAAEAVAAVIVGYAIGALAALQFAKPAAVEVAAVAAAG